MQNLCVVVPCYNEASRLQVDVFKAFIAHNNIHFCFVNDGSRDNTIEILNDLKNNLMEKVLVVDLKQNSGKAEAVRLGVLKSNEWKSFSHLAYFDADLAIPLAEINNLLEFTQKYPGYLLLMGARLKRLGAEINRKPLRHIFGRAFATFASNLFNMSAYDTQCGFKLFKQELVENIFDQPFYSKWFFDIEILLRIRGTINKNRSFEKICEVPIWKWEEIDGSKLKLKDFILVPFQLLRLKAKYKNYQN